MNLKEKAKNLPSSPGVYLMRDSLNSVIYVGKSKNLKSRVSSYFQNSKSHTPKVLRLIGNIRDFSYIVTDTEFEAFLLECELIGQIKPPYNKMMKNPKSYLYINVSLSERYPYLSIRSESHKDKNGYSFGPFTNKGKVKQAIEGIKIHFKILCSNSSNNGLACFNHSLGYCKGVCLKKISRKEYESMFRETRALFNGKDKTIVSGLRSTMNSLSRNLKFEEALKYRNYIGAINSLVNKLKVVDYTKKNKNIVVSEYLGEDEIKIFLIKGNNILFREKYGLDRENPNDLRQILKERIYTFFSKSFSGEVDVEREEIDRSQIIYSYLQGNSENIRYIVISDETLKDLDRVEFNLELNKLVDF